MENLSNNLVTSASENSKLESREIEIWNRAIEKAAFAARIYGPPPRSWSESSIIINDTCDEISHMILELKQ